MSQWWFSLAATEVNSLVPSRFPLNFRWVIFKHILVIDGQVISCEITLRWMSQGLTDDKSTLIQVMAWCHQATSHYLNQCWSRSMSPYGVTRLQWVRAWTSNDIPKEIMECNYWSMSKFQIKQRRPGGLLEIRSISISNKMSSLNVSNLVYYIISIWNLTWTSDILRCLSNFREIRQL